MCIDVSGIEVKPSVNEREKRIVTAEQFLVFLFVLFCHVYPGRDSD